MDIVLLNIIPFVLSALVAFPAVRRVLGRQGMAWGTAAVMAVLFGWLTTYIPTITEEGVITHTITWVPDIGLALSWYLDGLALAFALIVTGVGVAVFLYAGYYLEDETELGKFYLFLGAFAGSMLAVVMAGNVFMLFIAWEGTSIMSFLLIGFKGAKSEEARIAASRALVITGGGGLALFVGLMLMGVVTGSFELSTLLTEEAGQLLRDHPWYVAITLLIMLGAFTKSAQFPFHFWLPGAMTAPSPASAYLHSATMVKAGIYLLFRLYPTLGDTWLWINGLLIIGLTTMFLGAFFSVRKRDLKALLAYSTVSKLGAIIALIGLPEAHGLKGAIIGIIAHALYKATFFLLAGTVEHSTGTRNLDSLGGLRKHMPVGFFIAAAVGLSMAGFPPMVGFAAKEFLLDEMLPLNGISVIPVIIAFLASIFTVVAALLFVWDVFVSRPDTEYDHYHAPSWGLHVGPALLAVVSLVGGLFIAQLFGDLVNNILGKPTSLYLIPPELNPLENTAFGLSIAVLIMGPLLFAFRRMWLNMPWVSVPTGVSLYAAFIGFWEWLGDQLLKTQNGKLRYYLVGITGVVAVLMLLGGYENLRPIRVDITSSADLLKIMLLLLAVGSTIGAIVLRKHLLAALAMGVMGYAVGGLFLLEPAPDVALVQFLVETTATVLIILMIARISASQRREVIANLWRGAGGSRFGLWRDAVISLAIGVSVGLFALAAVNDREARLATVEEVEVTSAVLQLPAPPAPDEQVSDITRPITLWHLENAYPLTGVTDVVSAILADFRATDTLIEISVFGMAALGVFTLLTMPQGRELLVGQRVTQETRTVAPMTSDTQNDELLDEKPPEHASQIRDFDEISETLSVSRLSTPLTRLAAVLVLPFALLISAASVLYGGIGPGDGFTAGVVGGLGVSLWYVVFGYFEARARLQWVRPGRLIAFGLLLALTNAAMGLLLADGFFNIFKLGDGSGPASLHLASTLIFELSIFLTVFGGVTMIMSAIAHPRNVEQAL